MATERLIPHFVKKPWGVNTPPKWLLAVPSEEKIGEVWYQKQRADGSPAALLLKFLMTSERLSVQVHPDDEAALAAGLPNGKSECWYVLDATGAGEIALGLNRSLTQAEAAAAALDGSIVDALDWRKVKAGDFFYVPARTVHAIGAGCTLVEVQQNSDTTYRLFDYGRPRELHLKDGLAVSNLSAGVLAPEQIALDHHRRILVRDPHFVVERWEIGARQEFLLGGLSEVWVVVLSGSLEIQGSRFKAGEVAFHADDEARTVTGPSGVVAIVAYPGGTVEEGLLSDLKPSERPLWDEGHNPGIEPGALPAA